MDLVLGLSMTSRALRWVLIEGTTGEGAPIDRGALDIAGSATFDADDLLEALLEDDEAVAASRLHAIGVTWSSEAEAAASILLEALATRGLDNVVAVSEIEATEALASGIADIAGYDDVAVCIVEPDAAVVAVVNSEGVTADRIDTGDAVELSGSVIATLDLDDQRPDAIFVVGSDDLEPMVSSLADAAESPVISAAEADMALARGAALASAMAVNTLDAQAVPAGRHRLSRIGAWTSVLAAAVVTFVVALSVALGLRLTPDPDSGPAQVNNAADEKARVASPPSVVRAAPQPSPPAVPPPNALPLVALTKVVAVPPPVYQPIAPPPAAPPSAPAYVPPAPPPPAYVPPPAPNFVPPPVIYPKPRLRDRIIERIPIINRFHEPELQYPR